MELDGSVRIAWAADGFAVIRVLAPRRSRSELAAFARTVADVALVERTLVGLRAALRDLHPGAFELQAHRLVREGEEPHVTITLNPPKGEPNLDLDV